MKTYLIYFSPGGSTKKTLRNIAKGLINTEIVEIDMMKQENRQKKFEFGQNDLVLLGMMTATKLFGVPSQVIGALKGNNTPFVGVVTCGNGYYGSSLKVMKKGMEKRGFTMIAGGGFIGKYSFGRGIAENRPDQKDEAIQLKFGEAIHKKLFIGNNRTLHSKIGIDWPKEGSFSTIKCAIISMIPGLGMKLPASWNKLNFDSSCIKCDKCVNTCPVGALSLKDNVVQDQTKCIGCQACVNGCPKQSITIASNKLIKSVENVAQYRSKRKEPKLFI
ncbi:MAG: EFR1 family ferrodoxin [Marinifilaceae bacterium]|jgi:ferredoxin|nr:EFR1 family ferrodoxin [Marinifilaceae bacterium]